MVEVLCCKPEGRRFEFRLAHFFNLPNPSSLTIVLGFAQPPTKMTEMSTRKSF
jgi:hypothetical protein